MRNQIAGETGLIKLTATILGTFVLISVLEGMIWNQWILGLAAIYVAWRFAIAITPCP